MTINSQQISQLSSDIIGASLVNVCQIITATGVTCQISSSTMYVICDTLVTTIS